MNNQTKDSIQELEYIESRLKLANEAVELIHEFEEIVSEIGISIMREVSINEEKLTIKAIDPNDNDLELELYEVATVYRSIIDGCGPCGGIFEEEIDFRIDDIEDDYKNKSKEEFRKNPVHFLCKSSSEFFYLDGDYVCLNKELEKFFNNEEFINSVKDAIDFRTKEYYKNRFQHK